MTKDQARMVTTDAEIDAALERAKEFETSDPRAIRAEYQPGVDLVVLHLRFGIVVALPRKLLQGLQNRNIDELSEIEILGPGTGLLWPRIDVAHYVPALLEGVFGNRAWMVELERANVSEVKCPIPKQPSREHRKRASRRQAVRGALVKR